MANYYADEDEFRRLNGLAPRTTTPTKTSTSTAPVTSRSTAPVSNNNYYKDEDDFRRMNGLSPRSSSQSNSYSQPQNNYNNMANNFSQALSQYSLPYEQALRDLLASAPKYSAPSEEALLDQATQYANLQIDPAIEALKRVMEQNRLSADSQRDSINANYASFEDTANRMLQEAANAALESAISRGGGRSGAVEWLTNKQQAPVMEQMTNVQADRTARLNAIADALALSESQGNEQLQSYEERRGQLTSSQLEALRQLTQAQAQGNWQNMFNAVQSLSNAATQANQFAEQAALARLPYYAQTESERQNNLLNWTQLMGEVPSQLPGSSNTAGLVQPLRSYGTSRGANIDYDPNTDSVLINGRSYSNSQLQNMGGQRVNGSWYLPQSVVDALF